jgi:hypothetical protein
MAEVTPDEVDFQRTKVDEDLLEDYPELRKKARDDPKSMTDEEWKKILSPEQFDIARNHGTEAPNTGIFNKNKEKGTSKN